MLFFELRSKMSANLFQSNIRKNCEFIKKRAIIKVTKKTVRIVFSDLKSGNT